MRAHMEERDKQIIAQQKRIEELEQEIQLSNDDLARRICDIRLVDMWVQTEKQRVTGSSQQIGKTSLIWSSPV